MTHNCQPTLMLKKTTLKNLSLDGAVVPSAIKRPNIGGTGQINAFDSQGSARVEDTLLTFTSLVPRF